MATTTQSQPKIKPIQVAGGVVVALVFIAAFMWLAGTWAWRQGWAYVAILVVVQSVGNAIVAKKQPGLLSRRSRLVPGTPAWDKICLLLFGAAYCAIVLVAAWDYGTHGASLPGLGPWLGGVVLLAMYAVLMVWSMVENRFFEKTVRLQTESNHEVIDTGPYRFVRHPGYVATLGFIFAAPLLLGSVYAFVPAVLSAGAIIVRTKLEDEFLHQQLDGYPQYAQKVSHRLVPGVW